MSTLVIKNYFEKQIPNLNIIAYLATWRQFLLFL